VIRSAVTAALLSGAGLALAAPAGAATCPRLTVPGAERTKQACLRDLTTAGTVRTGHTNPTDYAGLAARGTRTPSGVRGIQIDGYFPDGSHANANNGWLHDAQFVIRLPRRWNGKLVITGAPGTRTQYATDQIIGDRVLGEGYAFAATDKGNDGNAFYRDGTAPGDAIAEWNRRVTQLTRAAKAVVRERYGRRARRTYVTGISNGGYLTRYALEHHPRLYDGGVDWEGTLLRAAGPNLLTYLPAALRAYPRYRATGDAAAHRAMIAAGFAPGSELLWDYHYAVYWDLTQRVYREELDPGYDGPLEAGVPFCQWPIPFCDAQYDYAARPASVRRAVARVQNTGRIGKRLITLQGTLDTLLPIRTDGDVYRRLVRRAGRARLHRYYRIAGGNHVDGLYDDHPDRLRPMLPCWRRAFDALDRWVTRGRQPPRSQTVRRPAHGDLVNSCRGLRR
jgi:dienelactone hydrolase